MVEENSLTLMTDPDELRKICEFVLVKYVKIAKKAKREKPGEFGKLVKATIKESNNRADPETATKLLKELLSSKTF